MGDIPYFREILTSRGITDAISIITALVSQHEFDRKQNRAKFKMCPLAVDKIKFSGREV